MAAVGKAARCRLVALRSGLRLDGVMNARRALITAGIALLLGSNSVIAGVGPGTWEEVGPYARLGHRLLADPTHDRLLLVTDAFAGEVWARSLANPAAPWYRLAPAGGLPISVSPRAFVVDPVRERLLVCGGTATSEVWALPLVGPGTWAPLATQGTPPPAPLVHHAFYDAAEDRLVLCKHSDNEVEPADLWELRLSPAPTWAQLAPLGAPPDSVIDVEFDPVRREVLVLGETANAESVEVQANRLATLTWERRSVVPQLPAGSGFLNAFTFDSQRARWIQFGGWDYVPNANTFELPVDGSATAWTQVPATGLPPTRFYAAALYDAPRDRILVHGGQYGVVNDFSLVIRGDLWALSRGAGPSWTAIDGPDGLPCPRENHAAILDTPGDRMIVLGGGPPAEDPPLLPGLWAWPLDGNHPWQKLEPLGSPPPERAECAAVFDPLRRRMLVFGGRGQALDDSATWSLSLGDPLQWSVLAPAGSGPPPRAHPIAFYDPVGDRMILHGGFVPASGFSGGDTWALALAGSPAWSALSPAGTPTNANGFSAGAYDPVRHRLIAFGRMDSSGNVFDNTVWALTLVPSPAWTQLSPTGTPPALREGAALVYEPTQDRMILDSGRNLANQLGFKDTWSLDLAVDPPSWSQIWASTPRSRRGHTAIYDPVRDRIVMFGGKKPAPSLFPPGGDVRQDLWVLRWGGPVAVAPGPGDHAARGPRIVSVAPNPSPGPIRVTLVSAGREAVRLTLCDVRGRIVARALVPRSSGEVVQTLAESGRWAPGVYFLRASEAGRSSTARVCLLP